MGLFNWVITTYMYIHTNTSHKVARVIVSKERSGYSSPKIGRDSIEGTVIGVD